MAKLMNPHYTDCQTKKKKLRGIIKLMLVVPSETAV